MNDYKIFFIIIALIIILVLAYREINYLKQNITEINDTLKNQSDGVRSDVSNCVDRIEKISEKHITELQHLHQINNQQINKVHKLCHESESASEGLSAKIPEKGLQNEIMKMYHDKFAHTETSQIPIYQPPKTQEQETHNGTLGVENTVDAKEFFDDLDEPQKNSSTSSDSSELDIPEYSSSSAAEDACEVVGEMENSAKSSSSQKTENIINKSVSKYTIQELKDIAKKHNISVYNKIDGKPKSYKKSELYELLKNKLSN